MKEKTPKTNENQLKTSTAKLPENILHAKIAWLAVVTSGNVHEAKA